MDWQTKLKNVRQELVKVAKGYEELNRQTKHQYHWRSNELWGTIEIIDLLINDKSEKLIEDWQKCLNEDRMISNALFKA